MNSEMFNVITNSNAILAAYLFNSLDIITTKISLNMGLDEINPIMKYFLKRGWWDYVFIKMTLCTILILPCVFTFEMGFYDWKNFVFNGALIFLACALINSTQILLIKSGKAHYIYKITNFLDRKQINTNSIIILGSILIVLGLTGPWLHFQQSRRDVMYYLDMSPFTLSVRTVPKDLNLDPVDEFFVNYKTDATVIGTANALGILLVLIGIFRIKRKLSWLGATLSFSSMLLFPTTLPVIYSGVSFRWGMIMNVIGILIIITSLGLKHLKKRYDSGYPRILGRKNSFE